LVASEVKKKGGLEKSKQATHERYKPKTKRKEGKGTVAKRGWHV